MVQKTEHREFGQGAVVEHGETRQGLSVQAKDGKQKVYACQHDSRAAQRVVEGYAWKRG